MLSSIRFSCHPVSKNSFSYRPTTKRISSKFSTEASATQTPAATAQSTLLEHPNVMVGEIVYTRVENPSVKHIVIRPKTTPNFSFLSGQWVDFFIPKKDSSADIPKDFESNRAILQANPTAFEKKASNMEVAGFSMTCSPRWTKENQNKITFAIRKSHSPVAQYLHDAPVGTNVILSNSGLGDFYFSAEKSPNIKNVVLIGGGIGITPLMSILSHIYDDHDKLNATIVHSAKNEHGFIFRSNIQYMLKYKTSKLKAFWTTTEFADRIINQNGILRRTETDFVGRINESLLKRTKSVRSTNNRDITQNNTLYYVCGPQEMVQDVKNILLKMNVTEPFIRTEQW